TPSRRAVARRGHRHRTSPAGGPAGEIGGRAAVNKPEIDWRGTLKRRTLVAAVMFATWAAGIEAKLVYLQVYRYPDLVARASKQQTHKIDAPAQRGDIVDRRGRVLATSVDADSVCAWPAEIRDADDAAAKLCAAFGDCSVRERQALANRLHQTNGDVYGRRNGSSSDDRRHQR